MRARLVLAAATLLAVAVPLAACGSDADDSGSHRPGMSPTMMGSSMMGGSSTPDATAHNDADVAFATAMIPHHRQAVTMAQLAATRGESAEVKSLAAAIEGAQQPEIDTMSGWLQAWGQPVPSESAGMGMSGMGMPGMMSDDDMTMLGGLTGAAFDEGFLRLMIAHHQGAVEMARTERADGLFSDAVALAATIEQTQTAEIATMQGLLGP